MTTVKDAFRRRGRMWTRLRRGDMYDWPMLAVVVIGLSGSLFVFVLWYYGVPALWRSVPFVVSVIVASVAAVAALVRHRQSIALGLVDRYLTDGVTDHVGRLTEHGERNAGIRLSAQELRESAERVRVFFTQVGIAYNVGLADRHVCREAFSHRAAEALRAWCRVENRSNADRIENWVQMLDDFGWEFEGVPDCCVGHWKRARQD